MTTATQPPPGQRRYITQLEPSEYISGLFCISNTQLGRTKNDKPFLKVLVKDKTGEMAGRMWSIDRETYESLPTEGFAYLGGRDAGVPG